MGININEVLAKAKKDGQKSVLIENEVLEGARINNEKSDMEIIFKGTSLNGCELENPGNVTFQGCKVEDTIIWGKVGILKVQESEINYTKADGIIEVSQVYIDGSVFKDSALNIMESVDVDLEKGVIAPNRGEKGYTEIRGSTFENTNLQWIGGHGRITNTQIMGGNLGYVNAGVMENVKIEGYDIAGVGIGQGVNVEIKAEKLGELVIRQKAEGLSVRAQKLRHQNLGDYKKMARLESSRIEVKEVQEIYISNAVIRDCDFSGTTFRKGQIIETEIIKTNMNETRLEKVGLEGSVLRETTHVNGVFEGTRLGGADIRGADLKGLSMSKVTVNGETKIPDIKALEPLKNAIEEAKNVEIKRSGPELGI